MLRVSFLNKKAVKTAFLRPQNRSGCQYCSHSTTAAVTGTGWRYFPFEFVSFQFNRFNSIQFTADYVLSIPPMPSSFIFMQKRLASPKLFFPK
jgi:hypothetical protein